MVNALIFRNGSGFGNVRDFILQGCNTNNNVYPWEDLLTVTDVPKDIIDTFPEEKVYQLQEPVTFRYFRMIISKIHLVENPGVSQNQTLCLGRFELWNLDTGFTEYNGTVETPFKLRVNIDINDYVPGQAYIIHHTINNITNYYMQITDPLEGWGSFIIDSEDMTVKNAVSGENLYHKISFFRLPPGDADWEDMRLSRQTSHFSVYGGSMTSAILSYTERYI